jgi:hypothetical protein
VDFAEAFQAFVVSAFEDSLDHPLVVVPLAHYNFAAVHSFVDLARLVATHEGAKKINIFFHVV